MLRAASNSWIADQKRQSFAKGFHDGLMQMLSSNPYPVEAITHRPYENGYRAGVQQRSFLAARGMRHTRTEIERTAPRVWSWSVWVEGQIHVTGRASSERAARVDAEAIAVDAAFGRRNPAAESNTFAT
jgi:hypothetical protein